MSKLDIFTLTGDTLRESESLQREIHELAQPSYQDPSAILRREFADCTRVYLGRRADGRLMCFYLTAWETLAIDSTPTPAVHLGLSATRQETKNSGTVASLYSRCLEDVFAAQRRSAQPSLLWSTTASPTVFLAVTHYLAAAEPRIDGSFTPKGARIAAALRQRLGASPMGEGEHPFVLRGIAEGTRYSESERRRIAIISRHKRFELFDRLGVDETRHDRVLFTAQLPDDFRPLV